MSVIKVKWWQVGSNRWALALEMLLANSFKPITRRSFLSCVLFWLVSPCFASPMFVDAALFLHFLLPSSPSAWRAGHPNAYACGKEKEHFHCIQRNISIVLIHIIRIIIIILLRFLSIHDLSIDWQDLFLSLLVFLKTHQQNWVWFVSSLFHPFPCFSCSPAYIIYYQ